MALAEPFIIPYFVSLLSAPKLRVTLEEDHLAGHEAGCIAYLLQIELPLHETIEYFDLGIQFPGNISDYRFGEMNVSLYSGPVARLGYATIRVSKSEEGKCKIILDTYITSGTELTANKKGPDLIQIKGAKISSGAVGGAFILSGRDPSFKPAEMIMEGHFEYLRFGYSVSRPLSVVDEGVHIVQSAP
jgi:hypothetical protein